MKFLTQGVGGQKRWRWLLLAWKVLEPGIDGRHEIRQRPVASFNEGKIIGGPNIQADANASVFPRKPVFQTKRMLK